MTHQDQSSELLEAVQLVLYADEREVLLYRADAGEACAEDYLLMQSYQYFSRSVVSDQCRTGLGNANHRRKLPRL